MAVLDMFALDGKVAVVTGGSRGLGRAFALALAEAGADVAVTATSQEGAERTANQIRELGRRSLAIEADVRNPARAEETVNRVNSELGPIDILINNAGVSIHAPALEVAIEDWNTVWDVNVTGVWNYSRAVARLMIDRGLGGSIVNIGSMSGLIVNRPQWQPAYNASKAAVHHLTRSLAAEWAPYQIRVNALAPGYVAVDAAQEMPPAFKQRWIEDVPMRRVAVPEELGASIVYLASNASSFMTGAVIVADGGYVVF
ncbi:MAG: short-chain dehydrogenase/reductase [Acidimicrobiaceae bacterium]|nr:short-chain dehydrogenase/reductase [Acidimicrobiaceae bacterium]